MAAGRKEYELLLKLQAALGGNFNTTFQSAMNTTKQLQNSLQDIQKVQNDISGYKKTQDAITATKTTVADLATKHGDLKKRLAETTAKEADLRAALEKSAKTTGTNTEEYKRLEAELKKTQDEKAKLTGEIKKTETATDKATQKLTEQEKKLDDLSKSLKDAGVNTAALTSENERLAKQYNDLKKAQEDYARASSELDKNREAIAATRTELLKTVGIATAAGAALYKGFVSPAAEIESAMKSIQASTGYTGEEMERVMAGVRAAALATGTDVHALAKQTMNLVETGGDIDLMLGQLEHGLNLANATGTDAGQTFDFLSAAMKTFGLDVDSTQAVVDSFAYTTTMTNLTLSQISDAFVNVGGSASQAGMGIDDVNAILVALSEAGLKGGAAGTSLNAILRNLSTPTDKAAAALAELNVELYDQYGASRDMLDVMADLEGALGDMTDEQRNHYQATIFDTVALKGWNMIAGEGVDSIRELSGELSGSVNAFDELGQAAGMAAMKLDGLEGDSAKAKAQMKEFALTMGEMLLPTFRKVMQTVTQVTEKITTFMVENKETVAIVAKVVAGLTAAKIAYLAVKLAVLQVQGVYKTIKVVKAAYVLMQQKDNAGKTISIGLLMKEGAVTKANVGALVMAKTALIAKTVATKAAAAAQWLFNAAMTANPIGLIIAAVAALIGIVILLVKNWDKVKDALLKVWETVKGVFSKIGEFFAGIFDKIKAPFVKAINWVKENWKTIVLFIINPFAGIFKILYDKCEGFRNFINGIVEKIKAIFGAIVGWFYNNVIQPLINIFAPIVQKIGEIFAKLWEIITVLFGVLASWFNDKVITPVVDFFRTLIAAIGGIFQKVWDTITGIFSVVVGWFSAKFTAAWDAIKAVFAVVGAFFSGVWDKITGVFSVVTGWFSAKFTEAWEAVKSVFSTVGAFFQGIFDKIKAIFTAIGTTIGNAIGDAFKFVVNSIIGFAEGMINKFIGAINKAIGLINKIPGVNIEPLTLLDIPRLEKGSSSTPDTFIAGDVGGKGGELVTNAKGRKVFTAAQTDAVLNNLNKLKAITAATDKQKSPSIMERVGGFFGAVRNAAAQKQEAALTQSPLPSMPSSGGGQSFTIQYSPTIHVDGNKPGDLEEKLKQNNESLLQMFKEYLRGQREDERRMGYA